MIIIGMHASCARRKSEKILDHPLHAKIDFQVLASIPSAPMGLVDGIGRLSRDVFPPGGQLVCGERKELPREGPISGVVRAELATC